MISLKYLPLIGLVAWQLTSCSSADNSQGLDVTLNANNTVYIINAPGTSCLSKATEVPPTADLGAGSFDAGNVTFTWNGSGNLTVAYIAVSLKGSNIGDFSQYVSSTEIPYVFDPSLLTGGNIVLAPGQSITSSACTLRFGGVSITDITKSGSGEGKLVVYGVPDNGDAPVSTISYFNFTFTPIP